ELVPGRAAVRRRTLAPAAFALLALCAPAGCNNSPPQPASHGTSESSLPAGGGDLRPTKLVIGLTPYLPPQMMKDEFAPLADYLARETGIPAEVMVAKDYTDLARRLGTQEVHLAVFSPFSYVRAKQQLPEILLLCTHIANGSSTYSAYLITHQESGVNTVEDLRGKR